MFSREVNFKEESNINEKVGIMEQVDIEEEVNLQEIKVKVKKEVIFDFIIWIWICQRKKF